MRPSPTTPIVLSVISTPVKRLRFHSPDVRLAVACGTRRATASNRAMACSAAETMFDVGALTTSTPRAVAAGTSTLSRPTPARATTLSRSPAAIASASTVVALRTIKASAPASAGSSASRSAPSTERTSKSSESTARALGASSSATRTTGRHMNQSLAAADPPIGDGDGDHEPDPAECGDQEQDQRDGGVAANRDVGLHPREQGGSDDQ